VVTAARDLDAVRANQPRRCPKRGLDQGQWVYIGVVPAERCLLPVHGRAAVASAARGAVGVRQEGRPAMMETIEERDARAQHVLAHFCGQPRHGFGETAELCEGRHDCTIVTTCPTCGRSFVLDEEQYEVLVAWTAAQGEALACGLRPLTA
jgi:hypothetical protein